MKYVYTFTDKRNCRQLAQFTLFSVPISMALRLTIEMTIHKTFKIDYTHIALTETTEHDDCSVRTYRPLGGPMVQL